ncbi:MAG: amino acid adenylation domain-containing protein [Mycobacteriales bacterium]
MTDTDIRRIPRPAHLHDYVTAAAARHPDRPAVAGPAGTLSYAELDRRADAMARRLRAAGAGAGDRVVVWADKSPAVIVAMQAALRIGAAYVPVDGSSPAARAVLVARDCGARALCTGEDRVPRVAAELWPDTTCVDLEDVADLGPLPGEPEPRVDAAVQPDDLAYILYTSGSTGTPKGVCLSHRNATAFVDWVVGELGPVPADRFANHAPLTFDISVLDLYAAFAAGACVHLVPAELAYAPTQLVDFLRRERITIWYSVPSALTLMMRDGGLLDRPAPAALRAVVFAGEPFPVNQVRQLAGWTRARLLNLYGPTETNVCTWHEVTRADLDRDRPVPIGAACCGDRVWAEAAGGRTCGPGEEGELLVDGPTVMLGYWGREPRSGPYRTGDIVRVLPDGAFEYVGRRDHLVKVRGHRVEPGEVEAALVAHPAVDEAAVVVEGAGVDTRLVAYAVPRPGGAVPGVLELKRHLAGRLPRYLIADEIRVLARLPRTPNGKVDRAALAGDGTAPPGRSRRIS